MTLDEFRLSLHSPEPPKGLSGALVALWWAGKQDWGRAHDIAADDGSVEAAWVHAHLHRQEGDLGNAAYWYRRAKKPVANGALMEEWDGIVSALLQP